MIAAESRLLEGLAAAALHSVARERRPLPVLLASLGLVGLIAAADYVTGYEIRLAILYLLPIGMATWAVGGRAGVMIALIASLCWLVTFESTHLYSRAIFFYWEGVMTVASFLVVVTLLTRLKQALAHSDQRFVTVLESLAAAVFVEDARSGQLLFANPRFRNKFGEHRPPMLPVPAGEEFAGELHDPATQRWYLVRSQPLRWVDGRATMLRLVSDISEEKRVRELVDRHRDALHRSSRLVALGEFASAIAHEINQPLAAIATYNATCLRLIDSGRGDAQELREAMDKCRAQAKRAGSIIQRLRGLLRHPSQAQDRQDLGAVARDALRAAEPEAHAAGVVLEFEPAAGALPVRADALLIEQVMLNLVRNAIEAVHGLAPQRRRVIVRARGNPDGGATLAVEDRGAGVAPALRERLFEAFVSDKAGGLGLGLSICRSVIESHGGSIAYEDAAGGGARFSFTLPGATP